jgi:3-hydroxyacyl-CoA dehydrogenase
MTQPSSIFDSYQTMAVIGAAGKMGSGISLLLLQEMARSQIAEMPHPTQRSLVLIDSDPEKLDGLKKYLRSQLQKWAEKNIISLRQRVEHVPSLISNREIIEAFLSNAMDIAHFASSYQAANQAQLIFEAIIENIDSKSETLARLKQNSHVNPYFFSNTSSIPISVLNAKASLEGRIIGFHFYNPPAVQKLIEIIPLEQGDASLTTLAINIAEQLNKQVILSKDVAGFIGNGYFLREIMFACQMAQKLSTQHKNPQNIYLVDRVTQDFLLRPMGLFQLMDYVGLDVVDHVGWIMQIYLPTFTYSNALLAPLMKRGHFGGQEADGSQKNGFFQYDHGRIQGIYDLEAGQYVPLESCTWKKDCDAWLGTPPSNFTWKSLSQHPKMAEQVQRYYSLLSEEKTHGAELAKRFLAHLQQTIQGLVDNQIASSAEDVNSILKKGFYHL